MCSLSFKPNSNPDRLKLYMSTNESIKMYGENNF